MKRTGWILAALLLLVCISGQADALTVGVLEPELPRSLLGDEGSVEYRFFEGAAALEAEVKEGDAQIDLILVPHTQLYRYTSSDALTGLAPVSGHAIGWRANSALLDRLGLEAPKAGWTWSDILALAREAKEKDANVYALPVGAADIMLYQYAALHVDVAAGTLDHDADLLKEIIRIYAAMLAEGLVPRAFRASQEEMCLFVPCSYEEGLLRLLRPEADGPDVFDYEGVFFGIFTGSDQIEEAQELLGLLAIPTAKDALPVGGMLHFASDLPAIADRYIAGEIYIDVAVSEIRKSLRSRLAD